MTQKDLKIPQFAQIKTLPPKLVEEYKKLEEMII